MRGAKGGEVCARGAGGGVLAAAGAVEGPGPGPGEKRNPDGEPREGVTALLRLHSACTHRWSDLGVEEVDEGQVGDSESTCKGTRGELGRGWMMAGCCGGSGEGAETGATAASTASAESGAESGDVVAQLMAVPSVGAAVPCCGWASMSVGGERGGVMGSAVAAIAASAAAAAVASVPAAADVASDSGDLASFRSDSTWGRERGKVCLIVGKMQM